MVISPCSHLLQLQMKLILVKEKNREDNSSLDKMTGLFILKCTFSHESKDVWVTVFVWLCNLNSEERRNTSFQSILL